MRVREAWIVEDEPAAASLAAEVCETAGLVPTLFRVPLPFLTALRATTAMPDTVVLDWRLEHELSSGLFLATRHRSPSLPVIYWTGSATGLLPSMIRGDQHTRIVEKTAGSAALRAALAWALGQPPTPADPS